MTLRRIDSYATSEPDKLAVQLSKLEDNITAALSTVHSIPSATDWFSSDKAPIQLAYITVTKIDTSVSALRAVLPSVDADTAWRLVGVKVKGGNNLTLYPVESTALIDGAASATLSAGLYLYVHDGTEWSRY